MIGKSYIPTDGMNFVQPKNTHHHWDFWVIEKSALEW